MVAKKKAARNTQQQQPARRTLGIGELLPNPLHKLSEEEAAIHKKIDDKINFKAPLLSQLDKLSNTEVITLLSRPRHPHDGKTKLSVQYSSNTEEETLLKTSFLKQNLPFLGLASQGCMLVGFCASNSFFDFLATFVVCYLLLGIGGVCFAGEYLLHRFVFNPQTYLKKSDEVSGGDTFRKLFSSFTNHCMHHLFMQDKDHITTHYTFYLRLIPAIMAALYCVLPLKAVALLGGGLFSGSVVSEGIHYSFHFGPSLDYAWYRSMKAAHMKHHFLDNKKDFGITNSVADTCLCTKSVDHKRSVELQRMQKGDILWNVKSMPIAGAGGSTTAAALKKP